MALITNNKEKSEVKGKNGLLRTVSSLNCQNSLKNPLNLFKKKNTMKELEVAEVRA